jgi:hypothetical protein
MNSIDTAMKNLVFKNPITNFASHPLISVQFEKSMEIGRRFSTKVVLCNENNCRNFIFG